jgi:hypothetical protein
MLTNLSGKQITHILARYVRVQRDSGSRSSMDIALDTHSLNQAIHPNGQAFISPTGRIVDLSRTADVQQLTSQDSLNNYQKAFDPKNLSSGYVFIDSIEFDDGKVIGPDTMGLCRRPKSEKRSSFSVLLVIFNRDTVTLRAFSPAARCGVAASPGD